MKRRLISVFTICILMLIARSAFALERWQIVQGEHLGFVLPDPYPIERFKLHPKSEVMESLNPTKYRKVCPAIANLYERIFRRLIVKNSLYGFLRNGPGIKLNIDCKPPSRLIDIYANDSDIVIPGTLVNALGSEDEIAALMAHEMAHVLFAHNLPDLTEEQMRSQEFNADRYGAIMVWNAGFNPACFNTALARARRMVDGLIHGTIAYYFGGEASHGTDRARRTAITRNLLASNPSLTQSCNAKPSLPFLNARAEYKTLPTKIVNFLDDYTFWERLRRP